MQITRAEPEFRPITIVLETQDDLDKFLAIVGSVADNKINHTPQTIKAAAQLHQQVSRIAYPGEPG